MIAYVLYIHTSIQIRGPKNSLVSGLENSSFLAFFQLHIGLVPLKTSVHPHPPAPGTCAMLQSRPPKHRRWYFFGPYLESLGNRCHLFLHPSAKIPPPPLVGIVMGFSAGSGDGSCENKIHSRDELRKSFMKHVFFKADQFDSHLPT